MKQKTCSKCSRVFPATPEYFSRDSHLKDGLYSSCKICESAKAKPDTPKRRFIEGTGVRYLKDGRVRCHAVSMTKLRAKAGPENRRLSDEEIWPDCQCMRGAVNGRYVCFYHGGSTPFEEPMTKDLTSFAKADLGDKVLLALNDPEILDQRRNIALLEARNAQLLEQLSAGGLTQYENLQALRKGLRQIQAGDVKDGTLLIEGTIESLSSTKASWDELRQNMRTIKDLQQAEVKRQKELRLTLTAEQVMAKFERLVKAMLDSVERNISDPKIIDGVYQDVTGALRESIGTPGLGLLASVVGKNGEDE